jgi:hypothetical protein
MCENPLPLSGILPAHFINDQPGANLLARALRAALPRAHSALCFLPHVVADLVAGPCAGDAVHPQPHRVRVHASQNELHPVVDLAPFASHHQLISYQEKKEGGEDLGCLHVQKQLIGFCRRKTADRQYRHWMRRAVVRGLAGNWELFIVLQVRKFV